MKRKLLVQMRNEWRDNIWLVAALIVVSLSVWILSLMLWYEVAGIFIGRGYDFEDVYSIRVESLPSESPEYTDYGENKRSLENEDRLYLMRQIRQSPNVEAAAWSRNALPYTMNFYGNSAFLVGEEQDTIGYIANVRSASPDIVKVLKLKSTTGKSLDELAGRLAARDILITVSYNDDKSRPAKELLGKVVSIGHDTTKNYRVADVLEAIHRTDYEITWGGSLIQPVNDEYPKSMWEIAVRVKPSCGDAFIKEFDSTPAMQQHGNLYLSQLTRLADTRRAIQSDTDTSVRITVSLMIVILIVIFLGLLGTFWFRVQQRVAEIAIRKVCGASNMAIFMRIIGEGIILLLMASVIGAILFWTAYYLNYISTFPITAEKDVNLYAELFTVIVVGIGIIISLSWPAYKAMHIEPAIAVKDE